MSVLILFLQLAAATKQPCLRQSCSRRAVAIGAAAALSTLVTAATADDVSDGFKSALDSLGKPGLKIEYDGPYMDRDTGSLRYPISSVNVADPVSGALLFLGAGATRLGGILPDEMPFNIIQKVLRSVGVPIPDLADDDFRKQFQDTWYGSNEKANLPEGMRSRKIGQLMDGSRVAQETPVVEAEEDGDDVASS